MPVKPYRILVTAGPTREMLDPVRFLSNVSTGYLGYEIARQAKRMGFHVTLVSGPTALRPPEGIRFVSVLSALDLQRAVFRYWPRADALIMTAAVCDYTPMRYSRSKIKRIRQQSIRFKRTPDILQALGRQKENRIAVGFSLETEAVYEHATQKMKRKKLDLIVAHWYNSKNNPFGDHRASMILMDRWGRKKRLRGVTKVEEAKVILKELTDLLRAKKD